MGDLGEKISAALGSVPQVRGTRRFRRETPTNQTHFRAESGTNSLLGWLQASALDDDMRAYVVELATSMLEDAVGHGSKPADVKDELKEAIAPMLGRLPVTGIRVEYDNY
eukprot:5534365-Pyramimonas_sp.AAC.1